MGYIPTLNNSNSLVLTAATEPTKYMDYIFTRGENRQWYLTALQESDKQPEATPSPTPSSAVQAPQVMVESGLDVSSDETAQPEE